MEQEVKLIDANKLKNHYAWWEGGSQEMTLDRAKQIFDTIIDVQPTVDTIPLEDYQSMERTVNKLRVALAYAELVRHGHWEEDAARIKDQCSVCGLSVNWSLYKTPYCPNCGAKMDGERKEDAEHN